MAALTLAAGLAPALSPAETTPTAEKDSASKVAPARSSGKASKLYTVKVDLRIGGLLPEARGGKGCDVQVKPGNGGCKFAPQTQHVGSNGITNFVLKDVQTESADRDCTVAITIHEPGQPELTVRRGLRLAATNTNSQLLPCYLSSPSRLAKTNEAETRKR